MRSQINRPAVVRLTLLFVVLSPLILGSECSSSSGSDTIDIINTIADAVIRIINAF